MAKIVVEMDAFVIPNDHRIYKLSPGKTHRFYTTVRDAKVGFMDIRGLDKLTGPPSEWRGPHVLKIIADDRWARELESRERGNKPEGEQGIGRGDRRTLTFLRRLLQEARKGDLVIVPVEGYAKDVLIGEFITDPDQTKPVSARDGEHTYRYIGRAIKWRKRTPKRLLSPQLVKALHTQTAFFTIDQELHEEVYKLAYENFIYRGRYVSEFYTGKDKFTAEDSAVVSTWLNGFDVLRHSIAHGEIASLPASFAEIGLMPLADRDAAELKINVNSPGSFAMKSADAFAFALMAFFALSACDANSIINDQVTVKLKKVGAADPGCKHDIEATIKTMAAAFGPTRLEQACKLGQRAKNDATITTSASLKSIVKAGK